MNMDVSVSTNAGLEVRPAKPDDQGPISELMYSSGAGIYDYLHGNRSNALDYIERELALGLGLCARKRLTVAVRNGKVVATGTFYDRTGYRALSAQTPLAMMRHYGLGFLPRLQRAIDTTQLVTSLKPDELYLANFGVMPEMRGTGIGTQLLQTRIAEARQSGYRIVSLDVETHNGKAEALYQRLGFVITGSKAMKGRDGKEYACKKMELFL